MKKIKHDHKGTKLLKLGIFASLMLAPLLAIAFKCAYVTFNKNAKDSYSGNTNTQEVEYTNIDSVSDFEVGKRYNFNNYNINTGSSSTQQWQTFFIDNVTINYTPWSWVNDQIAKITLYKIANSNTNRVTFYAYDSNNQLLGSSTLVQTENALDFDFNYGGTLNEQNYTYFSSLFYFKSTPSVVNTLDNAFYYAIDEMKNNELFNWTTNTALYTPTAAMTNGMGITTTALPILITYWLYLTAIYIVIDIVVELFTALTHMITSKLDT